MRSGRLHAHAGRDHLRSGKSQTRRLGAFPNSFPKSWERLFRAGQSRLSLAHAAARAEGRDLDNLVESHPRPLRHRDLIHGPDRLVRLRVLQVRPSIGEILCS